MDLLAQNKGRSFADDIIFRSLDSHLSDLRERQRAIDNQHPLRDFMELRLKGVLVDFGSIPLDILSVISGNLASLVQKAVYRLGSGKDSSRVPIDVKIIRHEIGRLASRFDEVRCYFSTGSCELIETVSSHAVKEILHYSHPLMKKHSRLKLPKLVRNQQLT